MAEFIISVLGRRGGSGGEHDYQPGDVVEVQEDGHRWGTHESKAVWIAAGNLAEAFPGFFVVLKIPGLNVEKARRMLERKAVNDITTVRRKWQFLLADLPQSTKDILSTTGEFTTTVGKVKNFIRDKTDGSRAFATVIS